MDLTDLPDQWDLKDLPDLKALLDHKDQWDLQDLPELSDLKEFKDRKDLPDLLVEMEKMEPKEPLDLKDLPDQWDLKEFKDLPEHLTSPVFAKYLGLSCSTTTPWSATSKPSPNVPMDAPSSVEAVPSSASRHMTPQLYCVHLI
jgi:hypothetical protein